MIDSNMRVLVSENGDEVKIGALKIGQKIIDPLTGADRVVVDVRVRRYLFNRLGTYNDEILSPVSIPARQVNANGDSNRILVSKLQSLLFLEEFSTTGRRRVVNAVNAASLVGNSGIRIASEIHEISYAAVFLDKTGYMAISGLLFKSCDLPSFHNMLTLGKYYEPMAFTEEKLTRYVN